MLQPSFLCCLVLIVVSCQSKPKTTTNAPVPLTEEQQMRERIAFGRQLFTDKRLSLDNTIACIDCHQPEKAFTDGLVLSKGVNGGISFRNAPSLLNVKDFKHFMFDAQIPTLEMQAIVPIQDQQEMAITMKELVVRLSEDAEYVRKSKKLYGRALDAWVITKALSDFERSLVSVNSRFDYAQKHSPNEHLTSQELKGWELFSGKARCIQCHQLPHFTREEPANNGYGSIDPSDPGRYRVTGRSSDYGKFKIPSLRNVELTAPYMHNGGLNTLDDVLDFYASDKSKLRNVDSTALTIRLSSVEKEWLKSFLLTLTDTSYLKDWNKK